MSKQQKTILNAPISRRRLLRGIGFGAGAAALAACGTGAAPAPTSAPAATAPAVVKNPGSTVEIVYWGFSGGVNEKTDGEVVTKFNESQKDVKVVVQVQGNYEETANKLIANAVPEALKKASPGTPQFRAALRDAIEATKDLAGARGVYNMSATDHTGLDISSLMLGQRQKGRWVLAK